MNTKLLPTTLALLLAVSAYPALAQITPAAKRPAPDIDLKLSCNHSQGVEESRIFLADGGEIRIKDGKLLSFRWESALHRRTHGFDCSIDLQDQLELQPLKNGWRVATKDAGAARLARGYDTDHGTVCLINLTLEAGDILHIEPSCSPLCGSRPEFSELKVHLPTGQCEYVSKVD